MASPLSIPSKSPASVHTTPSIDQSPSPSSPPPPSSSSLAPLHSPHSTTPTIPPLHYAAQINDLAYLDRIPVPSSSNSPSSTASSSASSSSPPPPHLDVNLRDAQGITALHWASINGHLFFVKQLLLRGAQVDLRGGDLDGTPLMWAARNGHLAIVHLLLSYNSDPTLVDAQSFNALHLAVHSSSAFLLSYLLFTLQPVAVDTPDQEGHTSLAWASYQGDAISVELLLKAGASPTRPDHQGLTPLHWAVTKGNSACIKRILDAGADLSAKDRQGKTARDMAIELKNLTSLTKSLAELGRDELTGKPQDLPLDPKKTRWAILILPFLFFGIMGKTLEFVPNAFFALLIVGFEGFGLHHVITKVLLGVKSSSQSDRITKSPYLCAIIWASLAWVGWIWITRYLHLPGYSTSNLIFGTLFTTCCWNFYRAITLDPGYVRFAKDDVELKETIETLVERGAYNGMSFCLTCMVQRPLRSKHSYATGRCVGRFDHYCPWVWNDIGVDNHRQFLLFVGSLVFGVFTFIRLSIGYFSLKAPSLPLDSTCSFPTPLCEASSFDTFALVVMFWAALQLSWTVVLLGVQVWQIVRQMTTLEVSNVGRYGYMGGKPGVSAAAQQGAVAKWNATSSSPGLTASSSSAAQHALNASGTAGDLDLPSSDPESLSHAPTRTSTRPSGAFAFLIKLLGFDRFLHSHHHHHSHSHSRLSTPRGGGGRDTSPRQENPFDLGVRRNCLDFWTKGGQLGIVYNDPTWEIPVGGFQPRVRERNSSNRVGLDARDGGVGGEGGGRKKGYERVALEEV